MAREPIHEQINNLERLVQQLRRKYDQERTRNTEKISELDAIISHQHRSISQLTERLETQQASLVEALRLHKVAKKKLSTVRMALRDALNDAKSFRDHVDSNMGHSGSDSNSPIIELSHSGGKASEKDELQEDNIEKEVPPEADGHIEEEEETRDAETLASRSRSDSASDVREHLQTEERDDFPSSPSPMDSAMPGGTWKLHFEGKNPRASQGLSCGPFSADQISRALGFDASETETLLSDLESLPIADDEGIRFLIRDDLAFLDDPLFLEKDHAEDPRSTFIVGWATREINSNISDRILRIRDRPLHTFVYPQTRKKWIYIGSLNWAVREIGWTIWDTLNQKRRRILAGKVAERSAHTRDDVAGLLTSLILQQFTVEITSGSAHLTQEMREQLGRQLEHSDILSKEQPSRAKHLSTTDS